MADEGKTAFYLNSTFPVLTPEDSALHLSNNDFDDFVRQTVKPIPRPVSKPDQDNEDAEDASESEGTAVESDAEDESSVGFKDALSKAKVTAPSSQLNENEMLTENADVAYAQTTPLVDLFFELEEVISGERLQKVLDDAWAEDSLATLKLIFNSRSIHLGKANRTTTYRALGWLADRHPVTLLSNLRWLVYPIIDKTNKEKAKDEDGDFVMLDPNSKDGEEDFRIEFGVSHGYWKDLLNMLALAANGQLHVLGNPRKVLNVKDGSSKKGRDWSQENATKRREQLKKERHETATRLIKSDPFYRALHLSIARLFAEQLQSDKKLLESGNKEDVRKVSLAAKWAPSLKEFHDKHTFIASSIAEILFPKETICPDENDREVYLKHAREHYRRYVISPLRKALGIVERDITAQKFENIKYERVPSLAMSQYSKIFATKDFDRFDNYIERVAEGKTRISGATLLPSTLVSKVRQFRSKSVSPSIANSKSTKAMVERKLNEIESKTLDGQWNTLVQRIRDSGKLEASMAVCDVSGSMCGPQFPDGSTPMDSSIGLSLLLAEVAAPPFGGAFITFSQTPEVVRVGGKDDKRTLNEKVDAIERTRWSMNTNFVAVFERLLLPMAIENKIKPEDMVKQLFVFSDMQFDNANAGGGKTYKNSFERIKKKFNDAGYELPRLVFWNLCGGRSGYGGGDYAAPKPTAGNEDNVSLVSGYSQAQLKMFLGGEEEEIVVEEETGEDGAAIVTKQKKKTDPLMTVRRAISHPAYRMLKVVD